MTLAQTYFLPLWLIYLLFWLLRFDLLPLLLLLILLPLAISAFEAGSLDDLLVIPIVSINRSSNNKLLFSPDWICKASVLFTSLFLKVRIERYIISSQILSYQLKVMFIQKFWFKPNQIWSLNFFILLLFVKSSQTMYYSWKNINYKLFDISKLASLVRVWSKSYLWLIYTKYQDLPRIWSSFIHTRHQNLHKTSNLD